MRNNKTLIVRPISPTHLIWYTFQRCGNPKNTSGGCVLYSLFKVPDTLPSFISDWTCCFFDGVRFMSLHVVKPELLVMTLTKYVCSRFPDPPCRAEIRWESYLSKLLCCVFGADAGSCYICCRIELVRRLQGCVWGLSSLTSLCIPLSVCLSINLSVTIRPDSGRLKGCISCLLLLWR